MKNFENAKADLEVLATEKEKLDYILKDLYDENNIDSSERIDIFIGSIYESSSGPNLFVKDLETLLGSPVTRNPYRKPNADQGVTVFIQPYNRKNLSSGDRVVLTVNAGKAVSNNGKPHELFNVDLCFSFDDLNKALDSDSHLYPNMPIVARAESICKCRAFASYKEKILFMLEGQDPNYEKREDLAWLEKRIIQEQEKLESLKIGNQNLEEQKKQLNSEIDDMNKAKAGIKDYREEYGKLEKELPSLREEKQQCQEMINLRNAIKDERDDLQQEKAQLEKDLPVLRTEKQKLSDELVGYWKMKQEYDKMSARKKAVQLSQPIAYDYILTPQLNLEDDNLIDFKKRLSYDYRDEEIHKFLMALCTTQIITLCGNPGTGKTTFVEEMCNALGAQCHMIEVQNNWTDKSDILGYYNPLDGGKYQSTAFLDALLCAKEDLEANGEATRLHIICLDEMNLAKIEHYFAVFLSKLQRKERTLYLLSEDLDAMAMDESSDLHRYRHFEIPKNVRFVGTLNMDESAQSLSPKVIDRCFFIEFEKGISKQKKRENSNGYYPASIFNEDDAIVIPASKKGVFAKLEQENGRFLHYAYQMYAVAKKLSVDDELFGDYLVLGKVLPGLKEVSAFDPYKGKTGFEKSNDRFNQFVLYGNDNKLCDYWRKK